MFLDQELRLGSLRILALHTFGIALSLALYHYSHFKDSLLVMISDGSPLLASCNSQGYKTSHRKLPRDVLSPTNQVDPKIVPLSTGNTGKHEAVRQS